MALNVYEPHKFLKRGIRIWKDMFLELIQVRELIWRLFIRDISAKYKQAMLGNLWAVIMPFVAIGTFMYLHKAGIFEIGKTMIPYPLYALIGLSIWQIFATGLNSGAQSLVSAGDMIAKVNFPREALVISSMAQTIFDFLIKFILILVGFLIFKFVPSWTIFIFPLALVPLFILTVGLSFIISLLNGIMRDTANVVSLLVTFLMFLTPVLYPIPDERFLLFQLNILTPLINAPRDLIATGSIQNPEAFMFSSAVSLLIFLVAWRIFHVAETKIPERV